MDVIIIGAGVIGASVALGLTRKGFKTLNLDALPAAGYGSTSNSSGIIRPFYSALESCALAHEARNRWLNWPEFLPNPDESGYAKYVECGMLMLLAEGDKNFFQNSLIAMKEVGVDFEHLSVEDLGNKFSAFDLTSFGPPKSVDDPGFGVANEASLTGGIFISEAGYVGDPQLAAHNLQRASEALGARFKFNTKIVAINRSGGRVTGVTTCTGENIEAAILVNVAGPHSSELNKLAGITDDMRVSTRPMRHEVAHVPAPVSSTAFHYNCVVGDGDTGVYMRPDIGDNILIGSLDPQCDVKDYVDAEEYNTELTEQWTRQVWRAAQRIPALSIPNSAQGVVGLYDATPDWIPVYDKSSLKGYYMAIGTSGNQFKNAPVIGDLMAGLISACEAGQNHDEDPVMFHLPCLNRTIDLSFFSRQREQHFKTSGTVLA
ncbi:MAG: FAD-dependent oxidoreductase [Xanthomonadales bacterium]|nr:FAD-dependent oxidoreductase [Xanthomonadales bacterium]